MGRINVRNVIDGRTISVDDTPDALADAEAKGWVPETDGQFKERILEQKYGDAPIQSFAEGAGRGLTFGGSDWLATEVFGADEQGIRERQARNPIASGAGEVTGALAPALLSGGTGALATAARFTPAGLAARAGAGVGRAATGLGRLGATAAEFAVEGGLSGAGQGASEIALSDDPMTAESLVAHVGSGALLGTGLGLATGVGGGLLADATRAVRRGVQENAEALARSADSISMGRKGKASAVPADPELDSLEKLKARFDERPSRAAKQADADIKGAARAEAAELKKAAKQASKDEEKVFEQAKANIHGVIADIREGDQAFRRVGGWTRRVMGQAEELGIDMGDDIGRAYDEMVAARQELAKHSEHKWVNPKTGEEFESHWSVRNPPKKEFVQTLSDDELINRWRDPNAAAAFDNAKVKTMELVKALRGVQAQTSRLEALGLTNIKGFNSKALNEVEAKIQSLGSRQEKVSTILGAPKGAASPEALERAHGLVAEAEAAGIKLGPEDFAAYAKKKGIPVPPEGGPTSVQFKAAAYRDRVEEAVKARRASLEASEPKKTDDGGLGIGETLASKAVRGVAHAAGTGIGGALGGWGGAWIGQQVGSMAGDVAAKAIRDPMVMKRIMAATAKTTKSIGEGIDGFIKAGSKAKSGIAPAAVSLAYQPAKTEEKAKPERVPFKQQLEELSHQVADIEATRAGLRERLEGIAAFDPALAKQMEDAAVKRVQFLHDKAPKDPGIGSPLSGYGRWKPSTMEQATFDKYVAAAENPMLLLEELKAGKLVPETAETVRELYPTMFEQIRSQMLSRIVELRAELPYAKRNQMSILYDAPIDSSHEPTMVATLQGNFAPQEPEQPQSAPVELGKATPTPTAAQQMSAPQQ